LASSLVVLFVRGTLLLELGLCCTDRATRISDSLPCVPRLVPVHVFEFVLLLALISFGPFRVRSDFIEVFGLAKIIDSRTDRSTAANQTFDLEWCYKVV
jgi:hypothetical protein